MRNTQKLRATTTLKAQSISNTRVTTAVQNKVDESGEVSESGCLGLLGNFIKKSLPLCTLQYLITMVIL